MTEELQQRRIAFLATDGVEQVELTEPWHAVQEAGGDPVLVSPSAGQIQGFNHLDKADTFDVDTTTDEADPETFDALVLPGGVANPDALRREPQAVALVRTIIDSGKPVAVICHGPWTIIEADRARGRTLTSWPSLPTDLRNAGANWVDEEVVICSDGPNTIVSSRSPDDLPAFCKTMVEQFASHSPSRS